MRMKLRSSAIRMVVRTAASSGALGHERGVEDEDETAVLAHAHAREEAPVAGEVVERLDHELALLEQLVDHEAGPGTARAQDDRRVLLGPSRGPAEQAA